MEPDFDKILQKSEYVPAKIPINKEDAALTRWLNKEVKRRVLLDSMEKTANFELEGPGTISSSEEYTREHKKSIKMVCPTSMEVPPEHNRSYSVTRLIFRVGEADWRDFNRISCWIYPDCPGFQNVWVSMTLNNSGEVDYPRNEYFEGTHHLNLKNGRWNNFLWEFPEVYRDCVTSISLNHNNHGSQSSMSEQAVLFFSQLELQKVKADHYEGWELEDRIAFCHSGYRPEDKKVALTQKTDDSYFYICDCKTEEKVFKGPVLKIKTELGTFRIMDFSDLETSGRYKLKIDSRQTKPFSIKQQPWRSAAWKTINFFHKERCGTEIPGVHLPCHKDCFARHPDGRRIAVGGGWHDAGDLSQGLCNTSETVHALLDMAKSIQHEEPTMYERLLKEARWGLNWMLSTRFGDGYRCVWTTIGRWTKNIIGDADDITMPAYSDPFENFCAAAAEAEGAFIFKNEDPDFAAYCQKCAQEDFEFAYERMNITKNEYFFGYKPIVQIMGEGLFAAVKLYNLTGQNCYLDRANFLARKVLQCQRQKLPDWDIPLRGFFYETPARKRPLAYDHRAHEQAPVLGLTQLCKLASDHPALESWQKGLNRYAEYIKSISGYLEPYGLLPAAIYEVNNPNFALIPREKSRQRAELKLKNYNQQVKKGIPLAENFYLRRFPVAFNFRGFFGVQLSKAKAAAAVGRLRQDSELLEIVKKQLEWIIGNNPFARSFMYGEGYDFPPQYSEFARDIAGELPVGIQTFENHDIPFMPRENNATFKEIWVHSSSRFLWTLADLLADDVQ